MRETVTGSTAKCYTSYTVHVVFLNFQWRRHKGTETQREGKRDRERGRDTERGEETERHRERQRHRDTERGEETLCPAHKDNTCQYSCTLQRLWQCHVLHATNNG